ncbi:MAG: M20/M25/M40 family metallo-hydrolase [Planctomycetes bacterium]|nr:M20/M25/M40 family metallo-hydrolase [Planctomycetota bacterium]
MPVRSVLAALALAPWLLAQEPTPSEPPRTAEERCAALLAAALEQNRAWPLLEDLAKVAPHRLSGSPGLARAVEWARARMAAIGLDAVRLQEVAVPHWERGEVASFTVATGAGEESFPILALGGSVGTPSEGLAAELVMVRSFEDLRALGERARGRIVFFNRPMPRALQNTFQAYGQAVPQRSSGASEAARAGGVAALVRSMTTRIDDHPHTGAMHYADGVAKVPSAAISTRGAERLAALLAKGPVVGRLRLDCRTLPDAPSHNVLGELRGRELPDEIVVIGAHLDAWDVGHGAHDDGAGVAHCLEAVRLLRELGLRPRRTIRVVLFTNEENGLRGARAYAELAAKEGRRHVAAFETDRGGGMPVGLTASYTGAELEALREAIQPLRDRGMGQLVGGGSGGADVSVLKPMGVPVFDLITAAHRYFNFHHADTDRVENVDERELAVGAAVVAWFAHLLAER